MEASSYTRRKRISSFQIEILLSLKLTRRPSKTITAGETVSRIFSTSKTNRKETGFARQLA